MIGEGGGPPLFIVGWAMRHLAHSARQNTMPKKASHPIGQKKGTPLSPQGTK